VKLEGRIANIYVSDEGITILSELAGFVTKKRALLVQRIREADENGLWVDYKLEDGGHLFLIRWDYIRAVELPPEKREKGLE